MRELKFRAWDKIARKYYKVVNLGVGPNSWQKLAENYSEPPCQPDTGKNKFYPDIVEVEQYTGLKDINGVEIYEGDILEDGSGDPIEYLVVKFEDGKFIGSTQGVDEDIFELTDLEVIGNIHENKDLLGDTNVTNMEEEE